MAEKNTANTGFEKPIWDAACFVGTYTSGPSLPDTPEDLIRT